MRKSSNRNTKFQKKKEVEGKWEYIPGPQPRDLILKLLSFCIEKILNQPCTRLRHDPRLWDNNNRTSKEEEGWRRRRRRRSGNELRGIAWRRARRRSCSSRTWRVRASLASASFSRRLWNSLRAMCPVCGGPSRPSGSFLWTRRENRHLNHSNEYENWKEAKKGDFELNWNLPIRRRRFWAWREICSWISYCALLKSRTRSRCWERPSLLRLLETT